jgi:hypothetical protein
MRLITVVLFLLLAVSSAQAQYYGNYTANPDLPRAAPQPPGTFNNPYGSTGNSPQLRDNNGGYHGNLNANPYDPNSVANPYGRYGSQYSPDSINNPYGQYGGHYSPQALTIPMELA